MTAITVQGREIGRIVQPWGYMEDLRAFSRIPEHHHDVVALRGMVLVYETDTLCCDGLLVGSLYVLEAQQPMGGMSWETYDRINREHAAGGARARLKTYRMVVRVIRCERGLWWQVMPEGARDGPFAEDWAAASNLVGRVVGVYQPDIRGGGQ